MQKVNPINLMDYVQHLNVIDPDSGLPVEVCIYKIRDSGAMVGIDKSFLEQDVDTLFDPYDPQSELLECDPYDPYTPPKS